MYVELTVSPQDSPVPELCGIGKVYCSVEDYRALLKKIRTNTVSMYFGRYDIPGQPRAPSVYVSHEKLTFREFQRIFDRTGQVDKVESWKAVMRVEQCCLMWFGK